MKYSMKKRGFPILILSLTLALALCLFAACENREAFYEYTEGLLYELNEDGQSYTVIGRGSANGAEIYIPSEYNGLPVSAIGDKAFTTNLSAEEAYEQILNPVGIPVYSNYTYDQFHETLGQYYSYPPQNCGDIEKVVIPDTVISIGDHAFAEDGNLKKVVFGKNVRSIGLGCFYNCDSLKSATLPNSITKIGAFAFYGCAIKNVIVPKSLKVIEIGVFGRCGAEKVILREGLTEIQEGAFYSNNIRRITLPDSLEKIRSGAFSNCNAIETVHYKGTREEFNEIALPDYSGLELAHIICEGESAPEREDVSGEEYTKGLIFSLNEDGKGYTLIGRGRATDKNVVIPAVYRGLPVTAIGDKALRKNVDSPDRKYENYYFYFFNNHYYSSKPVRIETFAEYFQGIVLRNRTTDYVLLYYIFLEPTQNCDDIESVTIPDSVTSIGERAFENDSGLKTVILSKNLFSIGEQAFSFCVALESITIPDSVNNIGKGAFAISENLKSVTLGKNLVSIGEQAFAFTGLKEIVIPGSVKNVETNTFSPTNLEKIVLSEGVTNVETNAFKCDGLKEIVLPKSIHHIAFNAFNINKDNVKVYYEGTKDEFDDIEKVSATGLEGVEIIFRGEENPH